MRGYRPTGQNMRRYGTTVEVREEMRLYSLCTVDGEGGTQWVSKWSIGPLCHTMRRYRPTVQVREEVRLDSLCTVDGEGGVHRVGK